jgi:plasmid stabilization system protein ParE
MDWDRVKTGFRKYDRWSQFAGMVLDKLHRAREGGSLSKIVAGVSIAGAVMEECFSEQAISETLRARRYTGTSCHIGGFLCDLLLGADLPVEIRRYANSHEELRLWESPSGGVAAVVDQGAPCDGPFVRDGDISYLKELLYRIAWGQDSDIMLVSDPIKHTYRGSERFRIEAIPDPGPYIGTISVERLAERLSRYGSEPRTVLIQGPSGVGKSVLARHISRAIARGSARTLKIASGAARACDSLELRLLVEFLQPTVLLLDDLQFSRHGNDDVLDVFESLRIPGCVTIATMMREMRPRPSMGDSYYEGMRPGRLDELIVISRPDKRNRDMILRYYYRQFGVAPDPEVREEILEATRGLSGAYLRELARRLQVHGVSDWEHEVQQLWRCAPPRLSRRGSADGGPRGRKRREFLGVSDSDLLRARRILEG